MLRVAPDDSNDPPVTLTLGSPAMIPTAFADLIGAIAILETRNELGANIQSEIIDQTVDELTESQMDLVERIAALASIRKTAMNQLTFNEWLGTPQARHVLRMNQLLTTRETDRNWPDSRVCVELRNYVFDNHPHMLDDFELAWGAYWTLVLAKYGDAETTTVESQHAVSIGWADGSNEIHPKTKDGVSRYEAERHANTYNDIEISRNGKNPDSLPSASVVRRTVIYGPWYQI
jgi:hypothetical protein